MAVEEDEQLAAADNGGGQWRRRRRSSKADGRWRPAVEGAVREDDVGEAYTVCRNSRYEFNVNGIVKN